MRCPCNGTKKVLPSGHRSQQQAICGGFARGWYPTTLAESTDPAKQLVLELVQGLCQVDTRDAALGFDLLINCVTVELQIDLGTKIKHLFEGNYVIDVGWYSSC